MDTQNGWNFVGKVSIRRTFPVHAFVVWDDALHIASAAVHGLDFIVSLNFEHIVKDKAIRITATVNEAEGYEQIGIYEPGEVVKDDEY